MKMKTISSKFNLLTIFLIMLTTLAAGSYVIWRHQINTFENFTQHGEEVAVMLAKNMEYGVYTENQQAISQSLQGLSENPDIAYLVVFNKEKKVLTQRNFLDLPQLPSFPGHVATLENKKVVIDDYLEPKHNKSYINIIAPVYMLAETEIDVFEMDFTGSNNQQDNPELIGYLQLGINQDRIYEDSKQFMLQTMLIVPLIVILGILLTLWQTKRITRPIKKLVLAAHTISNGEFGEQLVPSSKDEVAELTVAFNSMSQDLARYKAEVSKHRETLEEQVAQRTHDLQQKTNEAYELADKAKAASKAKSEFLATMSHEIRTPMNGVLGMTELLLNTEMSGRQKRLADTAYRSAESLLGIINNILDFSKIESGKFQLIINDFDVRQLLEETTEILATQAHNKGLELVLNLPVDLHGVVRSDAERLRQVLVNLLGNAIKFTQEGEVQLKVSWAEQSESDTRMHLLFEVSDTGSGIASEQQATIFESFTQVDGSITRRYGGTGLGLSISKQLVEMMGGELRLTSTLGQGSCFHFSLCFERSAQLTFNKADISALKGVNILIVDDNATNREILSEQLTHWGAHCYCAASGIQAINYLLDEKKHNKSYQVALLDWHMPEMDGLALAKLLRDEPLLQSLSLVMLSSDSLTFDHEQSKHHGISYFLNKPVIQQRLLNCLLELIGSLPGSSQNQTKSIPSKASKLTGKILLAEDNPVNQEVGMGILRAIGCQVEVVNNGLEAIQAAANTHYDAILMDCHMPKMDGFQATTKIREREHTQNAQNHIPIIALTADVQKGIIEKCLDAGMDDYLSKPFNKKQLQDILEKWLPLNHKKIDITPTTQTTSSTEPSVNNILIPEILDNLRELTTETGESLLNKAIKLFVNSAPKEIDALKHAIDHQDSATLTKIAHSFKSACGNLGAQALADCAASLEIIGKQGHTQGADTLLKKMQSDLPVILAALDKELDIQPIAKNNESTTLVQSAEIESNATGALPVTVNGETTTQIQSSAQNKRILLVDDDPSFRMITSAVLTASAFIVDEAVNCLQAMERVKQQKPDLVLLDAVMDEPDGFETCRLLRAEPNMTNVPIVMSTGLGDIDSINRAFDCGATDFMIKPLNYPILIHRLWFILRAEQNSAELRNSKRQLISAQRIARLGYWIWDVTRDHFQISEQLADLCGIDLQAFDSTLEGFLRLIEPDDRDMVKDMIITAPYSKRIQHIEYRLQTTGDEPIFVHQEMVKIIENGQGRITGTVQDVSDRVAAEKKIHHLAYFDNLTGLASRAYYQQHIQTIIKTANQRNEKFAFLFLDLDNFKDINDSLGHNMGDQLLKVVAKRLQEVVRDVDFAARLGGDEFCILLSDIKNNDAVAEVADRCLQKLNAPLFLNHKQMRPSISIGIAVYPIDGKNETELMKAADMAMYAAKHSGKQCYSFFSQDMAAQASSRLEKEQMLREAFEKEQFILYFQPQVSMNTGHMVGVEALIRWQHPEKGMIPPNDFIPLIEQMGLIVNLGNWVLKAACEQIVKWHEAGLPYVQVAVNISPLHFQDPELLDTITDLLEKTGAPAQYLELEVTESAMQTQGYLNTFKQLRQLGVKISIDDFGTGYSCLASLKQLPLDTIKIDKIFVDDVLTNPCTSLLLGVVIGLANALDYKLVAEGVETKDQALIMYGLGCQIIQGYIFSPPVPGNKIPVFINTNFSHPVE